MLAVMASGRTQTWQLEQCAPVKILEVGDKQTGKESDTNGATGAAMPIMIPEGRGGRTDGKRRSGEEHHEPPLHTDNILRIHFEAQRLKVFVGGTHSITRGHTLIALLASAPAQPWSKGGQASLNKFSKR